MTFGNKNMKAKAIRVIHPSEDIAYSVFHCFKPLDLLEGFSRKRDGATQVILLSDDDYDRFLAACRSDASVTEVKDISEAEFWDAPSNAI